MAVSSWGLFSPALSLPPTPRQNPHKPLASLLRPSSCKPIFVSKTFSSVTLFRPRISQSTVVAQERAYRLLAISGLVEGSSDAEPESEAKVSDTGANIDIKLPRRSLLVQFTCDLCGERTERLVNRLAYERGLIYVQCAGCLRHHKLVDNLGLMVEYDLRDDISMDSNTDQD